MKINQDEAERDLKAAEPALIEAQTEVDNLDKNKLSEIKTFIKPPKHVDTVMYAIMIIMGT